MNNLKVTRDQTKFNPEADPEDHLAMAVEI